MTTNYGMLKVTKADGTEVDLPNPSKMEWSIQDLDGEDGSGRNQAGTMFRDRVAVKRKLSCTWPPMRPGVMYTLLKAVEDEFFTISAPDAIDGRRSMTCYVGDRKAPVYYWNDEKQEWLWESCSFNFIER